MTEDHKVVSADQRRASFDGIAAGSIELMRPTPATRSAGASSSMAGSAAAFSRGSP